MKPDKHFVGAAGMIVSAACLIALTWVGTIRAIDAQRQENTARVTATLANQALTFTEQINRQILALDQTLRILVTAWETNPRHFDLEAWRNQAVVLGGLSRDMVLTDEHGIIRQSSVVEAINQNVSSVDYFRALVQQTDPADRMYIGPATIGRIMRQWHMNVARALHYPDGAFAGAIDADYRIAAITDVFSQTDLGTGAFVALAGLNDGKLRGAVGPASIDPDVSIAETPMFAAIRRASSGTWTGPSANDAIRRIHAFRAIPDRDLAVVVSMREDEAMRPATVWRQQAQLFAGCITGLLVGLALLLVRATRLARRREAMMAEDRAILAAANAQLEVARALANAKAEQLEATLAGMSDGVSMVDAHLCLVEWNAQFPLIAGVPSEILRVGLPMEEILRAQVRDGQFGRIADPQGEVDRRMARLRVAPFGVVQRQRPDGHTIELRRNRLPDGGFVTLYADITEHKRAEEALRRAQAQAEAANAAKSRFVAIVSHEIRTPLNALLNTVRLLDDSVLAPAQQSLLALARQSGDVLVGLINDILDISQMEAGKLAIRPSLFELRPLLASCIEMFAAQARDKGIAFVLDIAAGTPGTLLTDPARLRQVLLNLLSNAVKYARPGEVRLLAEPGGDSGDALRLTLKDAGPAIGAEARGRLFQPFSRLDRPDDDDMIGTGLGLSICHHLMSLLGGGIGCDTWIAPGGQEGNAFWVTLPAAALPSQSPAQALAYSAGVVSPATARELSSATARELSPATARGQSPATARELSPEAARELSPEAAWGQSPDAPRGLSPEAARQPRIPRTRILLTEDIPANQFITATLLRRQGHLVDIAAQRQGGDRGCPANPLRPDLHGHLHARNGRPGSHPDHPHLAAASLLHADHRPDRQHFAEDQAIFKAAGMAGMLGKPVHLAELLDVLQDHVWSGRSTIAPLPRPNAPDRLPTATPLLAAQRIDELRSNLPPETFAELVEECLLDLDHRLPALRRALAAGVPAAVISHAHTMVGMAAGYGMAALEARLRAILRAARDNDLASLGTSVVAEVAADFAESARRLREIIQRETA